MAVPIGNRRGIHTYAERLHTELVRATGRLADPTDLDSSSPRNTPTP